MLITPFLFSCGDDEEEYLDIALIEGTWWWDDGLYQQYVIFEGNTAKEFALDKYTGKYASDDLDRIRFYSDCKMTKYQIFMTRVGSHIGSQNGKVIYTDYKLKGDSVLFMRGITFKKVDPPTLPK